MGEWQTTLTLDAADSNGICEAQQPNAGGVQSLDLDGVLVTGGVAILDVARRILVSSTNGGDSARTFVFTGTDRNGTELTETVVGLTYTEYDFKTVTSITIDDDSAGNITVGTNEIASTAWCPLDVSQTPFNVSVFAILSSGATLTYSLEETPVNIYLTEFFNTPAIYIFNDDVTNMAGATTSQNGILAAPTRAVRITTSAYTDGTITFMVKQGITK